MKHEDEVKLGKEESEHPSHKRELVPHNPAEGFLSPPLSPQ